ncbi:polyprenyl synthetase family protein [Candidatus Omnitrophota bacterium]
MIEKIKKQIEKNLEDFLNKTNKDYGIDSINADLSKHIKEFCLRKGKRIRPTLLILSFKGYQPANKRTPPSIYYASTCIELLHLFMLIHDDIIDNSDLRRGKPTMHKLLNKIVASPDPETLGSNLSIIAGDIVYAFAIDAFLSIKVDPEYRQRALKYFVQTAAFTAMGEFIDTLHGIEKLSKVKIKDAFLNYTLKTARYTFDCPLVIGAMLAGADKAEIKKLSNCALHVGQAFQIQDDIIGIFDSEKNIGKSLLSDIEENKKTLLVCHAYETLKGAGKKYFENLFNKKKKTYKDLIAIRKCFIQSGTLAYCLKEIQQRCKKADKILSKIQMRDPYKTIIESTFQDIFKTSKRIAKENNLKF